MTRPVVYGGGPPPWSFICCLCCIIACIYACKRKRNGDDYAYEKETIEEHHEVHITQPAQFIYNGPQPQFKQFAGWNFAQSADWCAQNRMRIPDKLEMMDYMKGRNYQPVF